MIYTVVLFILQTNPNGWNPKICEVKVSHASPKYIEYCIANSKKYPICPANGHDPREAMWAQMAEPNKHGAYFEVLDCSWHAGMNPREKVDTK